MKRDSKIWYGEYKGQSLKNIPLSYIKWIFETEKLWNALTEYKRDIIRSRLNITKEVEEEYTRIRMEINLYNNKK